MPRIESSIDADVRARMLALDAVKRHDPEHYKKLAGPVPLMDHLREVDPGPHLDWWHIGAMAEACQALLDGDIERLLICAPPRTYKSRTTIQGTSSCRMRNEPRSKVMVGCAANDLVLYHSRHARTMAVRAGVKLSGDSKSTETWETAEGGVYKAITIKAGRFGFGWDLGMIDDPFTTMSMALSIRSQKEAWEIFNEEFRTRAQGRPDGGPPALLLTHQRYAKGDTAGRLLDWLEETGAEEWSMLDLKGYAERSSVVLPSCVSAIEDPRKPGEPLSDNEEIMREIDRRKKNSPRLHRAVDQQDPPEDTSGGHFLASWIHRLGEGRDDLGDPIEALAAMAGEGEIAKVRRLIRGHDFAAGGSDAVASAVLAVLQPNLGVEYVWFDPTEDWPPVAAVEGQVMANAGRFEGAIREDAIPKEPAMGAVVTANIMKKMRAAGHVPRPMPATKGKLALATPHASAAAWSCGNCARSVVADDERDLMPGSDLCNCDEPEIRPGKVAVLATPGAGRIVEVLHRFDGQEGGDDHLVDAMSNAFNAAAGDSQSVYW